jgi:hypothetical protein
MFLRFHKTYTGGGPDATQLRLRFTGEGNQRYEYLFNLKTMSWRLLYTSVLAKHERRPAANNKEKITPIS